MMKQLTALLALSSLTLSSHAFAASATGSASATVAAPINITAGTALSYGKFSAGEGGGTVNTAGQKTGDVTVLQAGNPGTFNVTGEPNVNFTITGPTGANAIKVSGPGGDLFGTASYPSGGTLNGGGSAGINVASTLTIPADSGVLDPGIYTGTYNMTVNY